MNELLRGLYALCCLAVEDLHAWGIRLNVVHGDDNPFDLKPKTRQAIQDLQAAIEEEYPQE